MSKEKILGDNLVILVRRDIWLMKSEVQGYYKWTTLEPQSNEGYIKQGSTLIFEYYRKIIIESNSKYIDENVFTFKLEYDQIPQKEITPEFYRSELINFIKDGTLAILEGETKYDTLLEKTKSISDYRPISNEEFTTLVNTITSKYIDQSILPTCDYIIDKRDTIDYQFADTYKNEWTIWEAIREIIQNSMDTETKIDIYTPNKNTIVIHDEGMGLSIKDFRMGGGEKAKLKDSKTYVKDCDPENMVRGAHGEGMKLTFLVLAKNPELYKFCINSRCLRATGEFVESKRFKDLTMNINLDPIQPQRGTTFILNAPEETIDNLIYICKTRFLYYNLYINDEKSKHLLYDTLSHTEDSNKLRAIGQIANFYSYEGIENIEKPLYVRGIYVNDIRTVFSYNFICPSLDSARNVVDIQQIKEQIRRIFTNLEFNGIKPEAIVEKFVRIIYDNKDIEFIEKNLYFRSFDISDEAKIIYKKVWDIVFGKNAFISTDPNLTQLAMEQIYLERDP